MANLWKPPIDERHGWILEKKQLDPEKKQGRYSILRKPGAQRRQTAMAPAQVFLRAWPGSSSAGARPASERSEHAKTCTSHGANSQICKFYSNWSRFFPGIMGIYRGSYLVFDT